MMEEQQLIRPDLRLASKSANLELNEKVYIFQNIFFLDFLVFLGTSFYR